MKGCIKGLVALGLIGLGVEIATNGGLSRGARDFARYARRDPEIKVSLGRLAAKIVEVI